MSALRPAVAVQNARRVAKIADSLRTRRRGLTSLSRPARELASTADEDRVLARVVAIIHRTFDARAAWIMLRDAGAGASTGVGPLRARGPATRCGPPVPGRLGAAGDSSGRVPAPQGAAPGG